MEGWEVVTSNDVKVGHVVATIDDFLIVEHGHLKKTRHPVPRTFAHLREQERQVCLNLPKDMISESPKVNDENQFDREEAARHYGLAEPDSPVVGDGEVDPDEAVWGPDRDADAAGLMHPEKLRAQIQTHKRHERFPNSPSFLGDRKPGR